jgi:hypothetical protein
LQKGQSRLVSSMFFSKQDFKKNTKLAFSISDNQWNDPIYCQFNNRF